MLNPDPTFHFDADLDSAFQFDADLDSTFRSIMWVSAFHNDEDPFWTVKSDKTFLNVQDIPYM